jgi:hypothetical protein
MNTEILSNLAHNGPIVVADRLTVDESDIRRVATLTNTDNPRLTLVAEHVIAWSEDLAIETHGEDDGIFRAIVFPSKGTPWKAFHIENHDTPEGWEGYVDFKGDGDLSAADMHAIAAQLTIAADITDRLNAVNN